MSRTRIRPGEGMQPLLGSWKQGPTEAEPNKLRDPPVNEHPQRTPHGSLSGVDSSLGSGFSKSVLLGSRDTLLGTANE